MPQIGLTRGPHCPMELIAGTALGNLPRKADRGAALRREVIAKLAEPMSRVTVVILGCRTLPTEWTDQWIMLI